MKVKTSELTGAALDWAVAKCEDEVDTFTERERLADAPCFYSTDWSQGGPIIEREGIALDQLRSDGVIESWIAARLEGSSVSEEYGPTPLVAAMRCFVASQMGDEVDVPDELKGE